MAGKRFRSWKWIILCVIVALIVVFGLIQAVPYGRSHTNPAATNEFKWTDPQAQAIARTSCYDCHSNQTDWWWATSIAPFSWISQRDVDEGRRRLNFSEYAGFPSADEFQRAIQGRMPPGIYTFIHRSAKLTDAERQTLLKGYTDGMAATGTGSTGGSTGGTTDTTTGGTTGTTTSADAAAVAIINQVCATCHSAQPALAFHAGSAADAKALIDDMVNRGATVTADQEQTLIQYYTR